MLRPLLIFVFCILFMSCNSRQELWITYNVQNLFDDKIDGTEYREFSNPNLWTSKHYQQKLINIATVIDMIVRKKSTKIALIALQEIENEHVLHDLVAHTKSLTGLNTLFIKNEDGAMGLGLVSRYPFAGVEALDSSLFNIKSRPVLIAKLVTPHGLLYVLVCHLPSYSSDKTGVIREQAMKVMENYIDSILAINPSAMFLLMGDFNIDDVTLTIKNFYNPWERYVEASDIRSFYFRGNWLAIDHFMLAPSMLDPSRFSIINFEPFSHHAIRAMDENDELLGPARFNNHQARGYSDHLPLVLTLRH